MRARALTLIPLLVLVLALSLPALALGATTCSATPGSKTLVLTSKARITKKTLDNGAVRYTACLRSVGRRVLVFRSPAGSSEGTYKAGMWRLAGRYVAFVGTEITSAGEGGRSVVVYDLRTGLRVYKDSNTTPAGAASVEARVTALVLDTAGSTAWIATDAPKDKVDVHAHDSAGHRMLASGADIDSSRLTLTGHTVTWYRIGGTGDLAS